MPDPAKPSSSANKKGKDPAPVAPQPAKPPEPAKKAAPPPPKPGQPPQHQAPPDILGNPAGTLKGSKSSQPPQPTPPAPNQADPPLVIRLPDSAKEFDIDSRTAAQNIRDDWARLAKDSPQPASSAPSKGVAPDRAAAAMGQGGVPAQQAKQAKPAEPAKPAQPGAQTEWKQVKIGGKTAWQRGGVTVFGEQPPYSPEGKTGQVGGVTYLDGVRPTSAEGKSGQYGGATTFNKDIGKPIQTAQKLESLQAQAQRRAEEEQKPAGGFPGLTFKDVDKRGEDKPGDVKGTGAPAQSQEPNKSDAPKGPAIAVTQEKKSDAPKGPAIAVTQPDAPKGPAIAVTQEKKSETAETGTKPAESKPSQPTQEEKDRQEIDEAAGRWERREAMKRAGMTDEQIARVFEQEDAAADERAKQQHRPRTVSRTPVDPKLEEEERRRAAEYEEELKRRAAEPRSDEPPTDDEFDRKQKEHLKERRRASEDPGWYNPPVSEFSPEPADGGQKKQPTKPGTQTKKDDGPTSSKRRPYSKQDLRKEVEKLDRMIAEQKKEGWWPEYLQEKGFDRDLEYMKSVRDKFAEELADIEKIQKERGIEAAEREINERNRASLETFNYAMQAHIEAMGLALSPPSTAKEALRMATQAVTNVIVEMKKQGDLEGEIGPEQEANLVAQALLLLASLGDGKRPPRTSGLRPPTGGTGTRPGRAGGTPPAGETSVPSAPGSHGIDTETPTVIGKPPAKVSSPQSPGSKGIDTEAPTVIGKPPAKPADGPQAPKPGEFGADAAPPGFREAPTQRFGPGEDVTPPTSGEWRKLGETLRKRAETLPRPEPPASAPKPGEYGADPAPPGLREAPTERMKPGATDAKSPAPTSPPSPQAPGSKGGDAQAPTVIESAPKSPAKPTTDLQAAKPGEFGAEPAPPGLREAPTQRFGPGEDVTPPTSGEWRRLGETLRKRAETLPPSKPPSSAPKPGEYGADPAPPGLRDAPTEKMKPGVTEGKSPGQGAAPSPQTPGPKGGDAQAPTVVEPPPKSPAKAPTDPQAPKPGEYGADPAPPGFRETPTQRISPEDVSPPTSGEWRKLGEALRKRAETLPAPKPPSSPPKPGEFGADPAAPGFQDAPTQKMKPGATESPKSPAPESPPAQRGPAHADPDAPTVVEGPE
ncbi:MAG: hypothetical protein HY675_28940 [Chloroflexi bacterium]|nr:hypothetical protein [Chloroflexota bacterium]